MAFDSIYLFCLEGFADAKGNAGFVEGLVSMQGHSQLIPDPEEEEPPLGAIDGALSYKLVKALGVELSANLADPRFPGLALFQFLVQLLLMVSTSYRK